MLSLETAEIVQRFLPDIASGRENDNQVKRKSNFFITISSTDEKCSLLYLLLTYIQLLTLRNKMVVMYLAQQLSHLSQLIIHSILAWASGATYDHFPWSFCSFWFNLQLLRNIWSILGGYLLCTMLGLSHRSFCVVVVMYHKIYPMMDLMASFLAPLYYISLTESDDLEQESSLTRC